jgi:hypothetical protein
MLHRFEAQSDAIHMRALVVMLPGGVGNDTTRSMFQDTAAIVPVTHSSLVISGLSYNTAFNSEL